MIIRSCCWLQQHSGYRMISSAVSSIAQQHQLSSTAAFAFSSDDESSSSSKRTFKKFSSPRCRSAAAGLKRSSSPSSSSDESAAERRLRKEKELKLLKDYEMFQQLKEDQLSNIPPNLVVKTLYYPPAKSEIILLGVERRNPMHASFVHDCLTHFKPGVVTTQIAPDMPYLIRTKLDFSDAWSRFVRGKFDYKFYINPAPSSVYDIMLNADGIRELVGGGIANSANHFELGSLFMYTPNHLTMKFEVDAFLTPLLYLYNNPQANANLLFNDYPVLKYRDNVNRMISLKELKEIHMQFREVLEQKKSGDASAAMINFDPMLLKPALFIQPKIAYITESIRNASHISNRVIAIVDRHTTEDIEAYWMKMEKEPKNLAVFLKDEYFSDSLAKERQATAAAKEGGEEEGEAFMDEHGIQGFKVEERETYIEYIEKHVILDLMIDPILRDYFVRHSVFPFTGKSYIGQKSMIQQIFVMLEHFYHTHSKPIRDVEPMSFDERQVYGAPNDFKDKKEDK